MQDPRKTLLGDSRRGLRSSFGKTSPGLVKAGVWRELDKRLAGYQQLKQVRDGGEINRVFDAAGRLVEPAEGTARKRGSRRSE